MYLFFECIRTQFSQAYLISGLADISGQEVLLNVFTVGKYIMMAHNWTGIHKKHS